MFTSLTANIIIVSKCSKNGLAYPFDIDEEISLHQKPTLPVLHYKGSTWTSYEYDSQILDYIVSVWQMTDAIAYYAAIGSISFFQSVSDEDNR
jgi:hypothetical protein